MGYWEKFGVFVTFKIEMLSPRGDTKSIAIPCSSFDII